ncbi:MAG: TonB-dependent receptor, partial [Duncaniella sp.]|nr:TonB-dependent receptor [Duncaniella sp.]
MRTITVTLCAILLHLSGMAQRVTLHAKDRPASEVFREIVSQTGKNFVYSSDLLDGVNVSVDADRKPLAKVLDGMFRDTEIRYRIKGKNVILRRHRRRPAQPRGVLGQRACTHAEPDKTLHLDELVVISRLEAPQTETAATGSRKITGTEIRSTPTLLGESDVIKSLHTQPGVTEGMEGAAGMNVHGGDSDQNLVMLDNVPLYQVSHFGGLFSTFNTDLIHHIDFYKTSIPARYDGRLSSVLDVRLGDGRSDGHHGTARLGLNTGALNLSGPIGARTTYIAGVRCSWLDLLSIPLVALSNAISDDEQTRMGYGFYDVNAKVTHRFSQSLKGFASVYWGLDRLRSGDKSKLSTGYEQWEWDDNYGFRWGNLVAQAGLNWRISPDLRAELTGAFTRYGSDMKYDSTNRYTPLETGKTVETTRTKLGTENRIADWVVRGDFDWNASESHRVSFGAGYVRHTFVPGRSNRVSEMDGLRTETTDSACTYRGDEASVYISDNWTISDRLRADAGIHASLFYTDRRLRHGLSPRVSVSYRPSERVAVKGAYTRTVQYVRRLTQSYLSLPTDLWIPVTSGFRPETADKAAIGVCWSSRDGRFELTLEGYWKWMHNLVEYRDEHYLTPPLGRWDGRLTAGRGTSRGIDFKIEKRIGRLTGHIAYSLAWADRTFREKNGGKTYPARFDQRHSINVSASWKASGKVTLNASWTGHSGNRFTLLSQSWETPSPEGMTGRGQAPLRAPLNNYRLPFYHRLDLSCEVRNRRGYWSFGLYNAYCRLNTVAITRGHKNISEWTGPDIPTFRKISLFPLIPSISYT